MTPVMMKMTAVATATATIMEGPPTPELHTNLSAMQLLLSPRLSSRVMLVSLPMRSVALKKRFHSGLTQLPSPFTCGAAKPMSVVIRKLISAASSNLDGRSSVAKRKAQSLQKHLLPMSILFLFVLLLRMTIAFPPAVSQRSTATSASIEFLAFALYSGVRTASVKLYRRERRVSQSSLIILSTAGFSPASGARPKSMLSSTRMTPSLLSR
mmetsp:Transcript_10453/g.20601  ORF Transcript_10453/g.20601 Transcript_10453/m.20601 type:complete len:211 (+) Transcript_10453:1180-1812(+)